MGNPQLPPGIFYQSNVILLTMPDSPLPTEQKARNFASSSEQFISSPHTKSLIAVVRNKLREKGRCEDESPTSPTYPQPRSGHQIL